MLHLYDRATMAHALTLELEPQLHQLLSERVAALGEELIDWTEFLVIQWGDTEADILRCVGFSPLIEPIDGLRWGHSAFIPAFDYFIDHGSWFELIYTFGSTFACILLVEDCLTGSSDLVRFCRSFTAAGHCSSNGGTQKG